MDDEPWHARRLRELEAAAPAKRKRTVEPFVKVPLWWTAAAHQGDPNTGCTGLRRAPARVLEGQEPDLSVAERSTEEAGRQP